MSAPRAEGRPAPMRYYDPKLGRDVVKIKPGEFFATTQPVAIGTVLGSCVSACIRDPQRGWAGMNHFMLPVQQIDHPADRSLCYGLFAMESLINEFIKHGSRRADLEAKVFGGASVMTFSHADVGGANAAFVVEYLADEGIRTAATDLGGPYPRRLVQFVESGEVWVKYLARLTNDTIATREVEYARSLAAAAAEPALELF